MEINKITETVIDTALNIHKDLGPGLLESVYETVLSAKLAKRGLKVYKQVPVDFEYDGIQFKDGFRLDLLIENAVIVELKSVEKISPVHTKQLLTYLRLMKLQVGLLINFGDVLLKNGIIRIVNDYKSPIQINSYKK